MAVLKRDGRYIYYLVRWGQIFIPYNIGKWASLCWSQCSILDSKWCQIAFNLTGAQLQKSRLLGALSWAQQAAPQPHGETAVLPTIGLWSKSGGVRETHCPFLVTVKANLVSTEISLRDSNSNLPWHMQGHRMPCSSPGCCGNVGFFTFLNIFGPRRGVASLQLVWDDLEQAHYKSFLVSK